MKVASPGNMIRSSSGDVGGAKRGRQQKCTSSGEMWSVEVDDAKGEKRYHLLRRGKGSQEWHQA